MSLSLLHSSSPDASHFGQHEHLLEKWNSEKNVTKEGNIDDEEVGKMNTVGMGEATGEDARVAATSSSNAQVGNVDDSEKKAPMSKSTRDLVTPEMTKGIFELRKENYKYRDTKRKLLISSMLTFFLCWNYLWGIVEAARYSVFWELAIAILLPFLGFIGGFERWTGKHEGWLIIVEGVYNMFTVITKLLILYNGFEGNDVMNFMFVGFFFFQVLGFATFQLVGKLWAGLLMSLTMAVSIGIQRYEYRAFGENVETANIYCNPEVFSKLTDPDVIATYQDSCRQGFLGQFLMWGKEAPIMMRLNYFFWVSNVLLCDYAWLLPSIFVPILHYVSVILAWWSGEFWHVRLLTASHLFILDGILLYRRQGPALDWTMLLPHWDLSIWKEKIVPKLAWCLALCCLLCPIFALACGQEKLFCTEYQFA